MFAYKLKELRQAKKITQNQLAKELNVSQQTIGSWEVSRAEPNTEMINRLADYFNVTTDYLLGRNDTPEWATDFETIELQELLRGNHSLAYNEGEVTEEDRKAIDNMITGYYWHKQQREIE